MSAVALALHQARYDAKRFLRDPSGLFFALAFPMVFLFVFIAVLGRNHESATVAGRTVASATYYLPAVLTISLASVNFIALAMTLTASRERGLLKRVRATPLPPAAFLAGRILVSVVVSWLSVVLVLLVGRFTYGVAVPASRLPGLALMLVVAAAAYCCLGFALSAAVRSSGAAAALTSLIALPLYFMSGLFARNDVIPHGVQTVASVLPIKPLFDSLVLVFDPATSGPGVSWTRLLAVAAWGIAGLLVTLRFFRWEPAGE